VLDDAVTRVERPLVEPLVRATLERVERDDYFAEQLLHWLLRPYAHWAPGLERYDFPAPLLEFVSDPNRRAYSLFIRACCGCGLFVPNETHPTGEQTFARCPACGSPTDQRAPFGPPGSQEYIDGPV
jgi:hypothetical protein